MRLFCDNMGSIGQFYAGAVHEAKNPTMHSWRVCGVLKLVPYCDIAMHLVTTSSAAMKGSSQCAWCDRDSSGVMPYEHSEMIASVGLSKL